MRNASIDAVLSGDEQWCLLEADSDDVLPSLPDDCFDVAIVDYEYSAAVHARSIRRTYLPDTAEQPCRKTRKFSFGFDPINDATLLKNAAHHARLVKRWSLVFSDTEGANDWRYSLESTGLDFVRYGFWVKVRAMPQITGDRPGSRVEQITIAHPKGRKQWNGGGRGNVWQHPVVANCQGHRFDRVHPAQKPESLMLELISLFTNEGDVVADWRAGSGTTGVCALRLGRRFVGIERLPEHAATARDRISAEESGSTLTARRAGQATLF